VAGGGSVMVGRGWPRAVRGAAAEWGPTLPVVGTLCRQ
jgi:hypothetical protein